MNVLNEIMQTDEYLSFGQQIKIQYQFQCSLHIVTLIIGQLHIFYFYNCLLIILLLKQKAWLATMSSVSSTSNSKYKIGQGAFGKVYRYNYEDQDYAIKKVYKDSKNHPELMEKIQAEGRIMQKVCNHRNVVGYLGQITKGKFLYLLTQFVPNGDLRKVDFIPEEDDLWEIVMQLAMVLHHLKKNSVIHRDIKPQNILIKSINCDNGQEPEIVLKLTDFGLAEALQDGALAQGIAGSPVYLAPQMVRHQKYGCEVDIWSLGITIFQLCHNQRSPYHDEIVSYISNNKNYTQKQLFNYLINLIETKKIKSTCPYPEINQLIEEMLNRDPNKRPTPFDILSKKKIIERVQKFNKNQKTNNMKMGKTLSKSTCDKFTSSQQKQNSNKNANMNETAQKKIKKSEESEGLLIYSPEQMEMEAQLFLSSRISKSLISQLSQSQFKEEGEKSFELLGIQVIKGP